MKTLAKLVCGVTPTDQIALGLDPYTGDPGFHVTNRDGHEMSVFPSRSDLIRMRRAIGEYLKATRKDTKR